jgi:hypothetical protein
MEISFTEQELVDLKSEIDSRVPAGYSDICITGSRLYGKPRLNLTNVEISGKNYVLPPSDLDVLVWYEQTENTMLRFAWNGIIVSVKCKENSKKHDKFYGFIIPQYSIITNEMFDWDDAEIQKYIEYKLEAPKRWSEGRDLD